MTRSIPRACRPALPRRGKPRRAPHPRRARGTLTWMPYLGSAQGPASGGNCAHSRDKAPMARRVHLVRLVQLAVAASAGFAAIGCVIPPPLQTDEPDAGANHPPVFRSIKDAAGEELTRPGPHAFVVGTGELRITAADSDLGDTLYLRLYVDYGLPVQTPALASCDVAPGATPELERTKTCSLLGVCTDVLADGVPHVFEIDLMDRPPTSTAARMYRDVTAPGEIATLWWNITCSRAPS